MPEWHKNHSGKDHLHIGDVKEISEVCSKTKNHKKYLIKVYLFAIIKGTFNMFNQQKSYKKAGLGALALFLTAGLLTLTFAFTNGTKKAAVKKTQTLAWYQYQPSTYSQLDVEDPANYVRVTSAPGCAESTNICAIELTDNGPDSNPTFDSTIKEQLWEAQNHTAPEVPANIKMKN